MKYDLIIRGGTVVDGTRLPRFRADIGVRKGRIARIGRLDRDTADREIDATGCIVAPGVIDLHTHYDAQIHWDPYCTISGWHGVTSVVLGNCGIGFAPVKMADRDRTMQMVTRTEQISYASMKAAMPWRWETFPEWMENLRSIPKGVNVLSFLPLIPLMVYVMGLEAAKSRPATEAEITEMKRLLRLAMDAGACGFSLQRFGEHSLQADIDGTPMPTDTMADEDVLALAEVLRERDEGFIQITQNSGGDPVHAGPEAKARDRLFLEKLAAAAQRPVIFNVVLALDKYPDFHRDELAWVHDCVARGLPLYAQGVSVRTWFGFTLENWNLYDASPAWNRATQGDRAEKIRLMSDPDVRRQMREEYLSLKTIGEESLPENVTVIATPGSPALEKYVGRKIGEIAAAEGKHPNDAMLDIAVAGDLRVEFRTGPATSNDPDLVGPMMRDPYITAGTSDGGAHTKFLTAGSYPTDLLTWLVRDTGQVLLEEAHWHLSCLTARIAGLTDRGRLAEGLAADIIVYDLQKLKRLPEWDQEIAYDVPANEWRAVQRAEGYRYILVNGEVTFEDGVCTGNTPGDLIRVGRPLHFQAAAE